MNDLTIAEIEIRQDEHGRYSLNDLYRASGGNPKNKPSEWMRNKQTKALIAELEKKAGIPVRFPGKNKAGIPAYSVTQKAGAFVVKELVYAYAMWISPAFNLKVIRAYDALVTGKLHDTNARLHKAERAYFARYPKDREIRSHALSGQPHWYIGQKVGRCAGTVGKAIRRMLEWGLIETRQLVIARIGMTTYWRWLRNHRQQIPLF